jgi:hypothetical protein
VAHCEDQVAPGRYSYWFVKLPPAAREKLVENGAIHGEHYGCGAHCRPRASGDCLAGSRIMLFSEQCQIAADIRKPRLRQNPAWHSCEYAVRVQQLARQVKSMQAGIACEIAKYVRELKRPAEFGRHPLARRRRLAKNPDRDTANRDGRALAIAVELRQARRSNIGPRVHAINDGEEVVAPQTVEVYGFAQLAGHIALRPSSKEKPNFTAPVG